MNSSSTNGGFQAALEAAHQRLGDLLNAMAGRPTAMAMNSNTKSKGKVRCRNYIKYSAPIGIRPRGLAAFHVADLCTLYNFPTGLAGGGVIGILELGGGYTQADLDLFSHLNGLPKIVPIDVPVNGGKNSPGDVADAEVLLDIQVAAAAYYYCTGQLPAIKMFFAPNADDSFAAVMKEAMTAGCDVLSISWGADEAAWDPDAAKRVEAAAQDAVSRGCIVFAAAGDNSSGDTAPGANVDMPAACPHVIGCGGTTKTRSSEIVWGDGVPNGRGTGGGFSLIFYPSPTWQLRIPLIAGSRMVPDVAADADPNTGYLVAINGQEMPIGGTSAVAPLYSGLFAAFGKKLGFVAPKLYQNPGAFVDITQGSNGSFQAAVGPDPCTGLGAPNGAALAALFAAP